MKLTVNYSMEDGYEEFVLLLDDESVPADTYTSRALTNTTSETCCGIFSTGKVTFYRDKTFVEVKFPADWKDYPNPAAELQKRVLEVKNAFTKKYPLVIKEWSVEI